MPNVVINTTAVHEHVGEIKRKVKVIKESVRGTINMLPYLTLPKLMTIELMHFCVMWMNLFPKLDAKHHCKAPFGAYCEVHVDPDITNTMEP